MYTHQEELKSDRGASLVEVLAALVILTAALTPAFYVSNAALSLSSVIRENMIATNLAQEGVEVIRSMRDANWFNGVAFNNGLADGTYQVEWNSTSLAPDAYSGTDATAYLRMNSAGIYTYSVVNSTATPFVRNITLTNISADQIRIRSVVTWISGKASRSVTTETYIFNWR